jgi:hypothetical protein
MSYAIMKSIGVDATHSFNFDLKLGFLFLGKPSGRHYKVPKIKGKKIVVHNSMTSKMLD